MPTFERGEEMCGWPHPNAMMIPPEAELAEARLFSGSQSQRQEKSKKVSQKDGSVFESLTSFFFQIEKKRNKNRKKHHHRQHHNIPACTGRSSM